MRDLDLDGRDEVRLATEGQVVVVELDEGAAIGSWDLRAARHALTGVLRRRPEAYHETLRRHERETAARAAAKSGKDSAKAGDAPASIHDRVQVKEAGLAERLVYDDYERRSGLIRVLPGHATAASWAAGGRGELGDFVDGSFRVERLDADAVRLSRDGSATIDGRRVSLRAEVELRIGGGRLDPTLQQRLTIENTGDTALDARIGSEWAITMLGGGGNPEAWWELEDERTSHDGTTSAVNIERLAQGNGWLGAELSTTIEPAGDAWIAPIETISNSEAGFERVYQGSALLLSWRVHLAPGARWSAKIGHTATIDRDRAKDDQPAIRIAALSVGTPSAEH